MFLLEKGVAVYWWGRRGGRLGISKDFGWVALVWIASHHSVHDLEYSRLSADRRIFCEGIQRAESITRRAAPLHLEFFFSNLVIKTQNYRNKENNKHVTLTIWLWKFHLEQPLRSQLCEWFWCKHIVACRLAWLFAWGGVFPVLGKLRSETDIGIAPRTFSSKIKAHYELCLVRKKNGHRQVGPRDSSWLW